MTNDYEERLMQLEAEIAELKEMIKGESKAAHMVSASSFRIIGESGQVLAELRATGEEIQLAELRFFHESSVPAMSLGLTIGKRRGEIGPVAFLRMGETITIYSIERGCSLRFLGPSKELSPGSDDPVMTREVLLGLGVDPDTVLPFIRLGGREIDSRQCFSHWLLSGLKRLLRERPKSP